VIGRIVVCLLTTALLSPVALIEAEQAKKISRVGFLSAADPAALSARTEAFRQGLRELGYVEGQNIVIEWRYAEGNVDRLREHAAELVRLKVDVIVTAAPSSTRAAKEVTSTVPIVMAGIGGDPVQAGFVPSLARPGGNITGLAALNREISQKQLELLKEIVSRLSHVAVLWTSTVSTYAQDLEGMELAARTFKIRLQYLDVRGPKDIETAFREARRARADAVLVLASPVLESYRRALAELAAKNRLPTIYPFAEWVEAGGLVSYGVSIPDLFRRAATYVHKILEGTKPADLPVELPTKFELIINLKAAKQIGLTMPPNVLGRADRVMR
jgi:putative ABC transport system substrate-binding protein